MPHSVTITAIIPVHNGERFLAEAIGSVLAQTLPPDEIIVVDDGSTDGSATVAGRFERVLVVRQPHCGIGAALNLAINHANGDFLAFLDADDRWLPDKLANQVNVLTADPTVDMVFGHVRQFREVDGGGEIELSSESQPGLSRYALLVRRSAFDRVGIFSDDPHTHSFMDWYLRAVEAGLKYLMLPDVVAERRIHANNLGRRTPDEQRRSYMQTLRQSMARRRSGDIAAL